VLGTLCHFARELVESPRSSLVAGYGLPVALDRAGQW